MNILDVATIPARRTPLPDGPTVRTLLGLEHRPSRRGPARDPADGGRLPEHDHGPSHVVLIPPHGHVRLRHEGNDHDLGPGTATHIEIGDRVSIANSGPEPAELMVVATPPDFAEHPHRMADRMTASSVPARRNDDGYPLSREGPAPTVHRDRAGFIVAGASWPLSPAHDPTRPRTRTVARLVRVVAQVAPGGAQALLAAQPPPRHHAAALMPWNGGNTAVLARALLGIEPLIDAAITGPGAGPPPPLRHVIALSRSRQVDLRPLRPVASPPRSSRCGHAGRASCHTPHHGFGDARRSLPSDRPAVIDLARHHRS